MKSVDLENSYKEANDRIKAYKTYNESKADFDKITNEQRDNLAKKKEGILTKYKNLKNEKKRYQREIKTQLDNLVDLAQSTLGSGKDSSSYLRQTFVKTANRIKPLIDIILVEEAIKALGCSQEQTFNQEVLYIPVSSTDPRGLLKTEPSSKDGKVQYERTDTTLGFFPYSMNRQLYERLQNEGQPLNDYLGGSGQPLFDIEYVTQDNNQVSGDFYKITLKNRANGINSVSNFINDYYSSIKILDTVNIYAQLMEIITGVLSINGNVGVGEIDDQSKFFALLQRILGLCFDDGGNEIDVSGLSKIGELDGVDETFFQFTEVDLRNIENRIANVSRGIVTFEDCDNVELPINSDNILNFLDGISRVGDDVTKQDEIADSLSTYLTQSPEWKALFPNSIQLQVAIDLSMLKKLPIAIPAALLSPKVLLPIMIMAKSLGQNLPNEIKNLSDLMNKMITFILNLASRIGAIFIEKLFEIIKKDIFLIIETLATDLSKNQALKKYRIVLQLIALISIVAQAISDYRKCKSVIDEILRALNLVTGRISIPTPLLAASSLLDGFSGNRAFVNVVEEFQKRGLPTGALPDGSPNLMLQSIAGQINGTQKEEDLNGKVEVFAAPTAITPAGFTLPNKFTGKKL